MLRRLANPLLPLVCALLAASCDPSPSAPQAPTTSQGQPASASGNAASPAPSAAAAPATLTPDPDLTQAIERAHQACATTPDRAPNLGLTCTTPTARAIVARLRNISPPVALETFTATFPDTDPARQRHAYALHLALAHRLKADAPPSKAAAQRLLKRFASAPAPLALPLAPLTVEAATLTGLDQDALRTLSTHPHPVAQADGYRHLAVHTTRHLGALHALTEQGDPRLHVAALDAVRLMRASPPDDACAWATDAALNPNARVAQAAGRAALRCGPAYVALLLEHITTLHDERKLNALVLRTLRNVCTRPAHRASDKAPNPTLCKHTLALLKSVADDTRASVRLRAEALWLHVRQHPSPDPALRAWTQGFQGHSSTFIRDRAAQALKHIDHALTPPTPKTAPTPPTSPAPPSAPPAPPTTPPKDAPKP